MAIPDIVQTEEMSNNPGGEGTNCCRKSLSLREGYMFVHSSSMWKPWSWKARYFILTHDCLYCFKRRGDLTAIPCEALMLHDANVSVDDVRKGLRKRFYLKISSNSQRVSLNVFCFIEEERDQWTTAILQALSTMYIKNIGVLHHCALNSSVPKSRSLEDSSFKRIFLKPLDHNRALSTSCMELTNMSVLPPPGDPNQTPTPIKQTYEAALANKRSSSSLDITVPSSNQEQSRSSFFLGNLRHNIRERPKSLLLLSNVDMSPDINANRLGLSSSKKKERKAKAASLALLGFSGKRDDYICVQ